MKLIPRQLTKEVIKFLDRPEVVAIKGPRQSGKTTFLRTLAKHLQEKKKISSSRIVFINFEDLDLREQFAKAPLEFVKSFISSRKRYFFLLDEYQYLQSGGQKLKLLFDAFGKQVKFIITGSSSLELTSQTGKFLVGRLFAYQLYPLSFAEYLQFTDKRLYRLWQEKNDLLQVFWQKQKKITLPQDIFQKEIDRHWQNYVCFGGYPAVVKAKTAEERQQILKNLVNTYLERDLAGLLQIQRLSEFRQLIQILATQTSQLVNYQQLSSDTGLHYRQLKEFLTILEETYLIKTSLPFHRNLRTELKKNPKIYFLDSGLRNFLISNFSDLRLRPDQGSLIESVIASQIVYRYLDAELFRFWRTTAGAEVDFVLRSGEKTYPLEVKYRAMNQPKISKAIYSFIHAYQPKNFLVLTKALWAQKKLGATNLLFAPACYF